MISPTMTTAQLTAVYDSWLDANSLDPAADALAHICFNPDLTHAQRYWLMEFVDAWKEAQAREDAAND